MLSTEKCRAQEEGEAEGEQAQLLHALHARTIIAIVIAALHAYVMSAKLQRIVQMTTTYAPQRSVLMAAVSIHQMIVEMATSARWIAGKLNHQIPILACQSKSYLTVLFFQ